MGSSEPDGPKAPVKHPSSSSGKRVLLIGWEGADWRLMEPLMEAGRMPHLFGMTERGVMGNLSTSIPMMCPILWTSIATGVFGNHHRILTPVEPDGRGDVRPVQSTSRRRKAIWNILSQNGLRSAVVGWPATHPAEPILGVVVSDRYPYTSGSHAELWPADRGTVHPPEMHERLMALRVRPEQLSGAQLASFVSHLDKVDIEKDKRVASIAALLAQTASVQQAVTWIARHAEWDFLAVYYGMLGGLTRNFLRYQSPPAEGVEEREVELYGRVVSTGYELHDMMLGRLLELVGPETLVLVVSDHGFDRTPILTTPRSREFPLARLPSEPRFSYLRHHRREAVICAAGSGVKKDELVLGARLTNIAPTILAYLGVAVPADMEGRVLNNIFETPLITESVHSYEAPHERDGVHSRELNEDPWTAHEMVDHFVALGLISLDAEIVSALDACMEQRDLNLAEILMHRGRFEEALKIYTEVLKRDDSFPVRVPIIQCLINLRRFEEAQGELEAVTTLVPYSVTVDMLWAVFHSARGDAEAAAAYLEKAERAGASRAGAFNPETAEQLGWIAIRLERWERAKTFFESALDGDPQLAKAHDGLGIALLRLGKVEDSIAHHLQSVHHLYYRSQGHLHLGEALAAAGQLDRAAHAFESAAKLDPSNVQAKKWLLRVTRQREKEWRREIDAAKDDQLGDVE